MSTPQTREMILRFLYATAVLPPSVAGEIADMWAASLQEARAK